MFTVNDIRTQLCPVPQQLTALEGAPLRLTTESKFYLSVPSAEKGPVKTAAADMKAYLTAQFGENCFDDAGIPVKLELGEAPAEVKNPKEAFRLTVTAQGITVTGFGESGLYYGVGALCRLLRAEDFPAMQILDWPDSPFRGYKEECRYGSNVMEKEDWFKLIDDMAAKRINRLSVALYGCWVVQWDGKVAEYLYLPIKNYPQLQTPQTVKYYSPTQGKWIEYKALPPIFRDNFFGEVVAYAKDRGMDVIPGINSFGHNTLFPRMLQSVAPKDENGNPVPAGFCTASEDTYKLLFSIYDQIIDDYLTPNDIHCFSIHLDEVWDEAGLNAQRRDEVLSPWCKCPVCREKTKQQIFIDHILKCVTHLKEKGITTVMMAHDMLVKQNYSMGDIGIELRKALDANNLKENLLVGWWVYTAHEELYNIGDSQDHLQLRSIYNPWSGYYIWSALTNPLGNVQVMARRNKDAKYGEGMLMYSLWDRSYDRIHDCLADYTWNYEGTGTIKAVTRRYVARHFPTLYKKCLRAYKLIDWISEGRLPKMDPENPKHVCISHATMLVKILTYYSYCYYAQGKPFPRHYPGEALEKILQHREHYERALYAMASMAKEAVAIFKEAALTPGCNREMARRMQYECQNYLCLSEDWIAILDMYDMTQEDNYSDMADLAKQRYAARLETMALLEQTKEKWAREGAAMRDLSVLLQVFKDIADYLESTDDPKLDLFDLTPIMSKESWNIR